MPRFKHVDQFEVNLERELGKGGFGKVFHARDTAESPPLEVAAKWVQHVSVTTQAVVANEVAAMRSVGAHPSIITLRHVVEAPEYTWIFLELATGGELFDRLIDSGSLSERATRPYARALVSALEHCHRRGIVHRDIKLENVMLCAEDPHAIKLVDFGLAVQLELLPDGKMEERVFYDGVGSRSYKAPEMHAHRGGYLAPPVDSWALGITLFSLMSGFFPFDKATPDDWRFTKFAQDVARGVSACDALFGTYQRACHFSASCKQMVDSLLTIDPTSREPVLALSSHAWLAPEEVDGDSPMEVDGAEIIYRSISSETGRSDQLEPPPTAMRIERQFAQVET